MNNFFIQNSELIKYLTISIIIITILVIVIQVITKTSLKKRTILIEKLKEAEIFKSKIPTDKTSKYFKKEAKKHLRERFSIFKRVAISVSVILVLLITSLPFIDRLPQAVVSMIVASTAIITGIAVKPFIENFLSGIAITVSKMLKIGDTIIINDNYGTIEDISATHTVVKIWNWRRYVIPNSTMINTDFMNLTLNDKSLWTHVEFYISYEANINKVKEIAIASVMDCEYFKSDEPPSFWVMSTDKDTIKCWVAAWANSPALAWELMAEMRTKLIINLQENNIKSHLNYHKHSRA